MNIGVNARMLLPGRKEGIARYAHETTKAMVLAHPEDTFHLFFDRQYDESYVYAHNVIPHVVPPQARHPLLWKLWFDWQLPRLLRKYNIDVFYSPDGYASLRTAVPIAMVSHDLAFEHFDDHNYGHHLRYLRKYAPLFHRKVEKILAVSETTALDIVETYGIAKDKIVVAGNATRMKQNLVDKVDLTGGKPYFVYIGSLNPRKNIVRLIEAYEAYRATAKSPTCLVLIGRLAWKSEAIETAIKQSKYTSDIIQVADYQGDVAAVLSQAKALIYPSLFEGFGIPILEGFGCQVPVITSAVGSMQEVGGEAVLYVDPYAVDSLVAAMHRIDSDKQLCQDLVEKGRHRMQQYTWEATAAKVYAVLQDLSKGVKS